MFNNSVHFMQLPSAMPNINTHVVINPKLNGYGLHLHFQRFETVSVSIFHAQYVDLYFFEDLFLICILQGGSYCNG